MSTDELRVLVWAPHGRDAALAVQLFAQHGIAAVPCADADALAAGMSSAGCAVITEEALRPAAQAVLVEALARQPAWSDFPFVMFAARTGARIAEAIGAVSVLGNVTVLERPVHSRTVVSAVVAALRARRRQYEGRAAIDRRDEFLAMLGHELRNPLAAMMLAVDALHRDCGAQAAKPRAILERQTRHLARLVDDLLDVARVTTGKVTLRRSRIELQDVLARCVANVEGIARPRGTTIALAPAREPAVVDGDLDRLEEVFTNLIANAVKYSPDGARVEVSTELADGQAIVAVRDNGVGIAPDMLARVFDLFAQAEATLDRAAGGLGIGLTVVRSLVELHGGSVRAASDGLGRGSSFHVELPLAAGEVTRPTPPPTPAIRAGLHVLVVDDNADLLELTRDLLVALGCEVETADDGPAALARLETARFDLALIDVGLPGIDGYEVVRRARERAAGLRIVMMTGYGQADARARAFAAGCDEHLTKPVSLPALQQVLAAVSPAGRGL